MTKTKSKTKSPNRIKAFIVNRVLGIHDTAHRIALGVGIGIFVTWIPLIGVQMVLILLLCTIFRANKVVGVPLAWISNPATLWIYYPNFLVGRWLLGCDDVDFLGILDKVAAAPGGRWDYFRVFWEQVWNILAPLFLGSVIVGLFLGAVVYALTYYAVSIYRKRLYHKALRKRVDREKKRSRPRT